MFNSNLSSQVFITQLLLRWNYLEPDQLRFHHNRSLVDSIFLSVGRSFVWSQWPKLSSEKRPFWLWTLLIHDMAKYILWEFPLFLKDSGMLSYKSILTLEFFIPPASLVFQLPTRLVPGSMLYSIFSDFMWFCVVLGMIAQQLGRPQNFLLHLFSLDCVWVVGKLTEMWEMTSNSLSMKV